MYLVAKYMRSLTFGVCTKINNPLGILGSDPVALLWGCWARTLIHRAYDALYIVLGSLNTRLPCYRTLSRLCTLLGFFFKG